ncbi:ATP-dependent DNA ligase [Nocardioides sp. TF02-7]|nr:ATP-dependent DNA ligase [Nocardioides sp. TF02-7]UMG92619.1 ATP-dependent DNA ligase [Nocardioides sp. TF02-7]
MASPFVEVEVDDRVVKVTNPDRVYFPRGRRRHQARRRRVLPGGRAGHRQRPVGAALHAPPLPKGLAGEKVHQKRLPKGAPALVETVQLHFPRWNRTADELCVTELGAVIWAVQMSTVEFHPWNSRRGATEQPDEWRIDLDPGPETPYADVRRVAHVAREVLDDLGAVGYPKTSGSKGLHVYVRIRPDHDHKTVRRAALAFAREVERRAPRPGDDRLVEEGPRPRAGLRRLQPERARPHHRRGVLAARAAPTPGSPPRSGGTRSTTPTRATSRSTRCRRGSPRSATCTRTSTTTSSTSPRCWSGRTGTRPRGSPTPPRSPERHPVARMPRPAAGIGGG